MILVFASLIALAFASSDFKITSPLPAKVNCGDGPYTVTWTNEQGAKDYFTGKTGADLNIDVTLEVEDALTNTLIAVMATVQYPATSATINWPALFPANWKDIESSLVNDGGKTDVTIEIQAQKNSDITSYCGLTCLDPDFPLTCCPAMKEKCPCGANSACDSGLMCVMNTCQKPNAMAGMSGGPCKPNNVCDKPSDMCDTASMTCKCKLGTLDCTCAAGNVCTDAGTTCQTFGSNTLCSASSVGAEVNTPCTAGSRTTPGAPQNACASPKMAGQLLACVNGKCAVCTTGTADCACANNACTTPNYSCVADRCVPMTGMLGQPCEKGQCLNGLVCANNVCMAPATTQAPVTAGCGAGSEGTNGCPCARNSAGQQGCTVMGLKCVNGVCTSSDSTTTQSTSTTTQSTSTTTQSTASTTTNVADCGVGSEGTNGCPCARNSAGQQGCSVIGLKCVNGVCTSSGSVNALSLALGVVAFVVALLLQ